MVKKVLKVVMIVLMLLGITLSVLNFISSKNSAQRPEKEGTVTSEGCKGDDLNC
jgi:F0F1-type ATP synthase assembly protein I